MRQQEIEKMMFKLKNAESAILELILLAYPLLLIAENVRVSPHYLIIVLAIFASICAYILFSYAAYSVFYTIILSLIIALPLYFIGMPVPVVIFIFLYAYWRFHTNYGMYRRTRWNFLAINTVVFTSFYFLTRSFLLKAQATEINRIHVLLFIMTTLLFIVLRYITIAMLKRFQSSVKLNETNKLFAVIMGSGMLAFLSVYFFIDHVRTAVISILGFLFGSLFMLVSAAITPLIDYIIDYLNYLRNKAFEEMEPPELGYVEFQMEEKRFLPEGAMVDIGLYVTIGVVMIAMIIFVFLIRKRKQTMNELDHQPFAVRSFGRKKNENTKEHEWLYHDATSVNAVRTAYQQFEHEARKAEYPRFVGETVKEWFIRMGWASEEGLFNIYDKVRYGSNEITEIESSHFIRALEKIKKENFSKKDK